MSQINTVTILTGRHEDAAVAFLNGWLPEGLALGLVGQGDGYGGDKAAGDCVYGICLNYGPLPDEWGDSLDRAPWSLRFGVTAVMDFELLGTYIWTGRHGWVAKEDDVVAVQRMIEVRHQRKTRRT